MGVCLVCCGCCFNNLLSKTLEIISIILDSISVFFLFLSLLIIKWSNIPTINVLLYIFMFLINIAMLGFTIIIRYWRSKGVIKNVKKSKALAFATACFALTIICFIICIIEEVAIIVGFYNADFLCKDYKGPYRSLESKLNILEIKNEKKRILKINKNDIDCREYGSEYDFRVVSSGDYLMAYLSLSYLEIALILLIWLYYVLRRRITLGQDGPVPISGGTIPQAMYDQYGRQVVVVQPGDVVVMGGQQNIAMPAQYAYSGQYYNQNNINQFANQNNYNMANSQNIQNQINPGIPNSQEFPLQEKIH